MKKQYERYCSSAPQLLLQILFSSLRFEMFRPTFLKLGSFTNERMDVIHFSERQMWLDQNSHLKLTCENLLYCSCTPVYNLLNVLFI